MVASALYSQATSNLENVPYPEQARKLVFAACRRRWENDREKLATLELEVLLGELLQLYPSLERLRLVLARIVGNLNKKDFYAEVADEVLRALACLYDEVEAASLQPIAPPTGPVDADGLEAATQISGLGAVARILEAHPQAARMRKLLYAACYNFWENDLDKLLVLDFQGLIEQVRQAYPTREQLRGRFQRIVRSLNKQAQYEQIAGIILAQLDRLYAKEAEIAMQPVEPASPSVEIEVEAAGVPVEEPVEEPVTVAPSPTDPTPVPSQLPAPPAVAEVGGETRQESGPPYNAFKLRREIMRYTTPLRAKALAFSLLHDKQLEPQGVDWLLLKTYNLDDLLRDLVQSHPSLDDLQESLGRTARGQSHRVEEALQAASAIVLAVRSIYNRAEQDS